MESPSRRGPPPPSNPPPRNISRSGRVPPPKGAPPGCARRARQGGRRQMSPHAEIRARTGSTSSVDEQQEDVQASSRSRHVGQASRSDEEGASEQSSSESFEDGVASKHGRGSRLSIDIQRQLHRRRNSPRRRREGDHQAERSSREQIRRKNRQSRRQGRGRDRRNSTSDFSSSRSSDGELDNDTADGYRGEAGDDDNLRDEKGRKNRAQHQGRNYQRKKKKSSARLGNGHHHETTIESNSFSEENGRKWAFMKGAGHEGDQQQHERNSRSKLPEERSSRPSDGSDQTDTFSSKEAEDRRGLGSFDGSDSQFYARRSDQISERRRSRSVESRRHARAHRHCRRSAELDQSEAERSRGSSSRCSWDVSDKSSVDSVLDRQEQSEVTFSGVGEDMKRKTSSHFSDDDEQTTKNERNDESLLNGAERSAMKHLRRRNKKLGKEEALEGDWKQPGTSHVEEKHGDSDSSQTQASTPVAQDVRTSPMNNANRAVVTGKPIRGARSGEAIGVRSNVFDTSTIPTKRVDLKDFVSSPLRSGPGTVLRCYIERDRSGTHKFSNIYSLYADLNDGSGRMLLAARKLLASKTAYYIICVRQDDLFRDSGRRGGSSFLAKLRASSVAHTEYAIYDRGENPAARAPEASVDLGTEAKPKSLRNPVDIARSKSQKHQENREQREFRRELGVIHYKFDKKEQRTGKRRMEVAIPQLQQTGDSWVPVSWQPSDVKESMISNFGRIRYQGAQNFLQDTRLLVFHQRESRYDPLSSCLVDYRGRATAPSVKNFQLLKSPPEDNVKRARYFSEGAGKDEDESDDLPKPVYLQMGKVGRDCFNVDVEWPLSVLQAFAICLSRFDTQAQF